MMKTLSIKNVYVPVVDTFRKQNSSMEKRFIYK